MAQVKRISGNGQEHSQSQIIISPSPYHLSKSDFSHHLILPVLISLLLRVSGISSPCSPVIVIVKICVSSFDMVAEQCPILGQLNFATSFCPVLSSHDDSTTTRPTNQITSSSGEKERSHWSSKLQEETDIKMFLNDPKLNPRLPITNVIRWCQILICRMVRRGTHIPLSHRLSGVCSDSSGSHWSQRRHHKESLH